MDPIVLTLNTCRSPSAPAPTVVLAFSPFVFLTCNSDLSTRREFTFQHAGDLVYTRDHEDWYRARGTSGDTFGISVSIRRAFSHRSHPSTL